MDFIADAEQQNACPACGHILMPTIFIEDSPEPSGILHDRYGRPWLRAVRSDGFSGWVYRLEGGLPSVWLTWGQLTTQQGPLRRPVPVEA